jgi:hypothetical protein
MTPPLSKMFLYYNIIIDGDLSIIEAENAAIENNTYN